MGNVECFYSVDSWCQFGHFNFSFGTRVKKVHVSLHTEFFKCLEILCQDNKLFFHNISGKTKLEGDE